MLSLPLSASSIKLRGFQEQGCGSQHLPPSPQRLALGLLHAVGVTTPLWVSEQQEAEQRQGAPLSPAALHPPSPPSSPSPEQVLALFPLPVPSQSLLNVPPVFTETLLTVLPKISKSLCILSRRDCIRFPVFQWLSSTQV